MSEPTHLVIAPLVIALAAAIGTLFLRRYPGLQRGVSLAGGAGYVLAVAALFGRVHGDATILTYRLSGWRPPFGIVLVADGLSTFMLGLAAVVGVAALAYSVLALDPATQSLSYHSLFHFMLVGVTGAFLTGDLFNLFVWFEVMLMASYVLVVFYGGPEHTRAALVYVVLNLVGSAFMLVAIGGLYAVTGTLNIADMYRRLADPATYGIDPAPVLGLSAILFVVFALKAGLVPFQWWVPAAYRAAPTPVAAVLAGVVKKVGIYAIIRLYFTIFATEAVAGLSFFGPVFLLVAAGSILLGGLGAISRDHLDDVLSYSSIGQVGFIVLPLSVGALAAPGATVGGLDPTIRRLAIAAALVYALNHALAKAGLFLLSGTIDDTVGTVRLPELGGLAGRLPVLSGGVFVAALGLVGIPPLAGFFGKLLIFDVAARTGNEAVLAAALVGAILTIAYVTRMWNRGFWGERGAAVSRPSLPTGQATVAIALALCVLLVGLGFDPVLEAALTAAEHATDPGSYVDAVDPGEVGGE